MFSYPLTDPILPKIACTRKRVQADPREHTLKPLASTVALGGGTALFLPCPPKARGLGWEVSREALLAARGVLGRERDTGKENAKHPGAVGIPSGVWGDWGRAGQ